jgi:hypothetical protein
MIDENIKTLIRKINTEIKNFESLFENYVFSQQYFEGSEEERIDFISNKEEILISKYEVIKNYFILLFDFTNSEFMYYNFKKRILNKFTKIKDITSAEYVEGPDDWFSILTKEFWYFLEPYSTLIHEEQAVTSDTYYKKNLLESILKETSHICNLSKIEPKSEPQVYNAVKSFINIIYPTTRNIGGQNFPTIAKVYKPDLIIPECRAAVEYKYIDNVEKINTTVAGIADDVKGYMPNREYNNFYAVFYFTKAFITKKRFFEIWKEKNFPSNWQAIYSLGR